ncbi:MAG: hypothetical protein ACI909_000206, partial [Planctomycetota bacterium]
CVNHSLFPVFRSGTSSIPSRNSPTSLQLTLPIFKEPLIKSKKPIIHRSDESQNPVKNMFYWMLVFTSTTKKVLNQRFLK